MTARSTCWARPGALKWETICSFRKLTRRAGIDFSRPILLGYSGISDALLQKYIEDSRHIWEGNLNKIRYTTVGSVIGTHAGPGAVVVAFFKKKADILRAGRHITRACPALQYVQKNTVAEIRDFFDSFRIGP